MQSDVYYMQLAFEQAKLAKDLDEVPVGAVLVCADKVIASGHNRQIIDHNPSAHAEIITLQQAGKTLGNHRLTNTVLYVTLEPCAMCFGAIVHARVSRLVFATHDLKTGVCGGCISLPDQPCFNHTIQIEHGIMQDECAQLLHNFFKNKRKQKKQ